jgi:hypothetical protein
MLGKRISEEELYRMLKSNGIDRIVSKNFDDNGRLRV